MLCLNVEEQQGNADAGITAPNTSSTTSTNSADANKGDIKDRDNDWHGEIDVYAAYKGTGKGQKGSKGYGECFRCGEWGYPRRECPHLNDLTEAKGALAPLKGGKSAGSKGKGKYGKIGKDKGNGNGKWGKGCNYQYRSPGKGVGEGFNELNDDCYNAWGGGGANEFDYN